MTVRMTILGKRILADIPYNLRDMSKQIPGRKPEWDKQPGKKDKWVGWTYPLTMDTCRSFRRVFGADLEILPALAQWARTALAREAEVEAARTGSVALSHITDRAPQLALAIDARSYQRAGAGWLAMNNGGLLGDQPGLGKTLQTLAALVEKRCKQILVFCPRTATRVVWATETERWTNIAPFVCQGSRKERERVYAMFGAYANSHSRGGEQAAMLICNTEMMRAKKVDADGEKGLTPDWPFLFSQKWDAIVVDESHQALAGTANTMSKRITQVRFGAMKLRKLLNEGGLAISLSGTPARSDLAKFWGQLNWVAPEAFTSFWHFAGTHFEVTESSYAKEIGTLQADGTRLVEPLDPENFARALRPYFLAREKAEVASDLPPVFYAGTPIRPDEPDSPHYVMLPMEGKQAEAYERMVRLAEANVEGGKLFATGVLAELTRRRQFALAAGRLDDDGEFYPAHPSNKLDWVMEFLREKEGNGKVVIASVFTRFVNFMAREIANEFGEQHVLTLTGQTSDAARQDLVKRFQDPDSPIWIVVINMQAGGVAITLDQADDMILTDLPWTSDEEQQVVDRIHRVSRVHNVTVYRLISEGTTEEWMAGLTEAQRNALRSAKIDPEMAATLK